MICSTTATSSSEGCSRPIEKVESSSQTGQVDFTTSKNATSTKTKAATAPASRAGSAAPPNRPELPNCDAPEKRPGEPKLRAGEAERSAVKRPGELLRPGALLVLTVKLVFRGRQQLLRQVEEAARWLGVAFEDVQVHWLFANKRHERTITARRKAW